MRHFLRVSSLFFIPNLNMSYLKPIVRIIDLSKEKPEGPSEAKVIAVPLPKDTVGIIFGVSWRVSLPMCHLSHRCWGLQQRTAYYVQRFNTYILNPNNLVEDPQAVWEAPNDESRFMIVDIVPPGFDKDPNVLSVGPFPDDRQIAIYCSHVNPDTGKYESSDPHFSYVRLSQCCISLTTSLSNLSAWFRDWRQVCHLFYYGEYCIEDCGWWGKVRISIQINAEDGGDSDYHDTVVGVAVG